MDTCSICIADGSVFLRKTAEDHFTLLETKLTEAIAQRDAAQKERDENINYGEESREDLVELTADLNKVRGDYMEVVWQRDMHACNAVEMMRQKEDIEKALATERAQALQEALQIVRHTPQDR